MIQDIFPKKLDNQFRKIEPEDNDTVIAFDGRNVLADENMDEVFLPKLSNLKAAGVDIERLRYAIAVDDNRYFIWIDEENTGKPLELKGYGYRSVNFFRKSDQKEESFAVVTALHYYRWYTDNRYCGRCGSRMNFDDSSAALNCTGCGHRIHPVVNPAVIIAVTDGNRLLMAKHRKNPDFPYALIAGFVEPGETAEETVEREVMEETGIKVKNIKYYGSQPWGIVGNLSIGYTAELDGDGTLRPDEKELTDAAWFEREKINYQMGKAALTGTMIHAFQDGEF